LFTNLHNFFNSSKDVSFKSWKMGELRRDISRLHR